ncbi:MAG: hypothetical protein ACUVTP_08850 [Candidatus Fervidibacter sp.]|uniref:hypothetical protein n=1 Tax=Candidatus Fervidibacter sp. TaxID=3100871 RepID=UPI004049ECF9
MDIRLGDLYELIVRIVDDRIKQLVGSEQSHILKAGEVQLSPHAKFPGEEESKVQALQEQIAKLVDLQRQLLEIVQKNQQRTEAILTELLNLLRQQMNFSRTSNGQRVTLTSGEGGSLSSENALKKENASKPLSDQTRSNSLEIGLEPSPSKGYTVMSPPDSDDEEIPYAPSDQWLNEPSPQPTVSQLASDGAPVTEAPPAVEISGDQLSEYLRRLFGIEVDYLRSRQTPNSPALEGSQVLVGEGIYNGEPVTLTIFGKSHITPTDVTVFYNAIVRPLRGSVTEPVMSVIFGKTFEPKALKVAYALDLLVVNLRDLMEMESGKGI